MCSNCEKKLAESVEMLWFFFNNFRNSAGRGQPLSRTVPLGLAPAGVLVERGALCIDCDRGESGAQGAGGRGAATGEPPRWAPVGPSAVVSAAHEPVRVGCRLLWGVGAAFWCPKWPVPLSRHRGGAGLVTATYRPSVREDIRANALDPPRIQNLGLKSPLTQGAGASSRPQIGRWGRRQCHMPDFWVIGRPRIPLNASVATFCAAGVISMHQTPPGMHGTGGLWGLSGAILYHSQRQPLRAGMQLL
jgi:hypothetical protein